MDEPDHKTRGARLRWARESAGIKSAVKAAEELGVARATYNAHERAEEPGGRDFSPEEAERYARRYKVSDYWLLTGKGKPKPDPVTEPQQNTVRVMGRIGAGAEILPDAEQVPHEGLFEISVPFPVPETAIALEVQGNSMWPRYDDGDVVICWREGSNVRDIIGWEAAVRTADGKRYLKRILKGRTTKLFDLESINAPTIRDVRLEWASEVGAVVRRGQWEQVRRNAGRISKKVAADFRGMK